MMSLSDCEVKKWSGLVRVHGPFLVPWVRPHRMRTKPRAHTAIVHSCVILVITATLGPMALADGVGVLSGLYHPTLSKDSVVIRSILECTQCKKTCALQ